MSLGYGISFRALLGLRERSGPSSRRPLGQDTKEQWKRLSQRFEDFIDLASILSSNEIASKHKADIQFLVNGNVMPEDDRPGRRNSRDVQFEMMVGVLLEGGATTSNIRGLGRRHQRAKGGLGMQEDDVSDQEQIQIHADRAYSQIERSGFPGTIVMSIDRWAGYAPAMGMPNEHSDETLRNDVRMFMRDNLLRWAQAKSRPLLDSIILIRTRTYFLIEEKVFGFARYAHGFPCSRDGDVNDRMKALVSCLGRRPAIGA